MNQRANLTDEFDEKSPADSSMQQFSELDFDIPKRSPIRRKDRQREGGGVQKKRKGNEKRKNSRLKYEFDS